MNPDGNGHYGCGTASQCNILGFYNKDRNYAGNLAGNGNPINNNVYGLRNRWSTSTWYGMCVYRDPDYVYARYRLSESYPGWWPISNHDLSSHYPTTSSSSCP